ncbi:aldehyde dehydrogenase family protein [Nocardia sp. alder85J]|nr:aldehyde dehydrogenase family protein [Nocardia sp. alder85J]
MGRQLRSPVRAVGVEHHGGAGHHRDGLPDHPVPGDPRAASAPDPGLDDRDRTDLSVHGGPHRGFGPRPGDPRAGQHIGELCGGLLRRCTPDSGGKSAAIVLDDADLDATVEAVRVGAFRNTGQVIRSILANHLFETCQLNAMCGAD